MAQLTLTRALAELKIIDSRINKAQSELCNSQTLALQLVGGEVAPAFRNKITVAQFETKGQAALQSFNDLLTRKVALRNAINTANATVKVKILGREMSIAEAVLIKNLTLATRQEAINQLKRMVTQINREAANADEQYRKTLQANLTAMFSQSSQNTEADRAAFEKSFEKTNKPEIITPFNITEAIEKMESELSELEHELDFVLSEANSTNYVEV